MIDNNIDGIADEFIAELSFNSVANDIKDL